MTSKLGHNRTRVGGVNPEQLRSIIERAERLEQEKANIAADIRELLAESKAHGYCTKAIRQILKLRKQDSSEREEQEAILDVYKRAMGILPLFAEEGEEA
jgi:uncharacterized protein (UPF0335 family)